MQFKEVITNRKSIRNYIDTPIEADKIEYILECARQAPSWANSQCWRFIVIQKTETIHEIAKVSVINRWLKKAPTIIVACADTTGSGNKNSLEYYAVDVAIAFEHLILAATDVGLGTCWIGGFNENKLKEILGIPPRIKVIAMTPVGYPVKKPSPSDKLKQLVIKSSSRKSLAELVHYEKW
jgi:nitroreductase